MKFRRPFVEYVGWNPNDTTSSFKRWGRVPCTGSATDFLYATTPTCPRCEGERRVVTEGVYRDCYIGHFLADCLLETVRQAIERVTSNG